MKKLTPEKVLEIYHAKNTTKELAASYCVSTKLVNDIKCKRVWKKILNVIKTRPGQPTGSRGKFLSDVEVKEIFLAVDTLKNLRHKYNVSPAVVHNIKRGKTYRKITVLLGIPGELKLWGLTDNDRYMIKSERRSPQFLSKKYNVTEQTIRNIKRNVPRKRVIY